MYFCHHYLLWIYRRFYWHNPFIPNPRMLNYSSQINRNYGIFRYIKWLSNREVYFLFFIHCEIFLYKILFKLKISQNKIIYMLRNRFEYKQFEEEFMILIYHLQYIEFQEFIFGGWVLGFVPNQILLYNWVSKYPANLWITEFF